MDDSNRTHGIEFGRLHEALETHEFPATCRELRQAYGEYQLRLPSGVARVGDVLERAGVDAFDDAESVRTVVVSAVGEEAVGPTGYSDRDPPASGSDGPTPDSF
jgi:hypothetical protein